MSLGVQPEQSLLRQSVSSLQAAAQRDPKPLAEPSPREGQHPCALLQQQWVFLCPSPGCKPLMDPCKPLHALWLSCLRYRQSWLMVVGRGGGKVSREDEWCRRGVGSPSDINTSACAWAHQVGIYTAKRVLHLRSPSCLSSHLRVHGRQRQRNRFLASPGFQHQLRKGNSQQKALPLGLRSSSAMMVPAAATTTRTSLPLMGGRGLFHECCQDL